MLRRRRNASLPIKSRFFGSLSEFVDRVSQLRDVGGEDENRIKFQGGTVADGLRFAREGWPEGTRQAMEMVEKIANRAVCSRSSSSVEPVIGYDVTGAAYDAAAYISGVPECWSTLQPSESKKAIRVLASISASGAVKVSTLRTRGIAIAALVLSLQSRGYVVTLDVADVAKAQEGETGKAYGTFVRVIDGSVGSPLDIDRIVFALAHPTMFRGLMSAMMDGFIGCHSGTTWGSSQPYQGDPDADDVFGKYDLYIGGAHLDDAAGWTDGGEGWVLSEFHRQTQD